jgi:hypothetical protein
MLPSHPSLAGQSTGDATATIAADPYAPRAAWSPEEDLTLLQLVTENGAQSWATIADRLPGRVGKQCRER